MEPVESTNALDPCLISVLNYWMKNISFTWRLKILTARTTSQKSSLWMVWGKWLFFTDINWKVWSFFDNFHETKVRFIELIKDFPCLRTVMFNLLSFFKLYTTRHVAEHLRSSEVDHSNDLWFSINNRYNARNERYAIA